SRSSRFHPLTRYDRTWRYTADTPPIYAVGVMKPQHALLDALWRGQTDRRAFLIGGAAVIGAGALSRIQARPRWDASPFSLGVASGDPSEDGVVLWTRLAPDPLNGGGMAPAPVEVTW